MAWIESHQDIARHPKTIRLAKKLNISIPAAIGHLHMLWWWALDFAPDGNLSKFESFEIAHACMWENDPDLLINALLFSGYLDEIQQENDDENGGISIHDWFEHGGKLIAKRAEEARRKKEFRENQKPKRGRPKKNKSMSGGRPADGECNSNSNKDLITTTTSAREEVSEIPSVDRDDDMPMDEPVRNTNDPFIQVLDAYCEMHEKLDFHVKDRERGSMRGLVESGVPARFINDAMRKLYAAKRQREEAAGGPFKPPTSFTYYAEAIAEAWRTENSDTTITPKGRDSPAHVDKHIESRRREIALNRWIDQGGDPNEFVYRPTGST